MSKWIFSKETNQWIELLDDYEFRKVLEAIATNQSIKEK